MSGIRLQVTGVKETRAKLDRARESIRDFTELWQRIGELMIDVEQDLFDTGGQTAEPVWPPLAESTIARKMSMGYREPESPMIATGRLEESLTDPSAGQVSQGRSSIGTFTANAFSWGTDVEYAGYHVDPRFAPEHTDPDNPPIRNLINVTPDLIARVNEICDEWLDDALREAGLGA